MTTKKILVVDDEEFVCQAVASILKRAGYVPIYTCDSKAVIELAKTELPDLLLLDLNIPDMSGFDVEEALNGDAATREMPIIFLTGLLNKDEEEYFRENYPGKFFLAKPLDTAALLEAIRQRL